MLPSVLQRSTTDHVPVLAEEVRRLVAVRPGETIVDATFGAGGHAALLASDLEGRGRLIAVDRDPNVRPYFESFRRQFGSLQARLLRGEFSLVLEQLAGNGVEADVVLLDLGISSMQIDRPERGFSYAVDAPLDMRMDPSAGLSARELERRMAARGIEPQTIRGIFVTHEHYDHSSGALVFSARWECPIFTTSGTADAIGLEGDLFTPFVRIVAGSDGRVV